MTRTKLTFGKESKPPDIHTIIQQLVTHFCLEFCKLAIDYSSVLTCKNNSFTFSRSCRPEKWKDSTVTVTTIMLSVVKFAVYVTVKREIEWKVMNGEPCSEKVASSQVKN